MKYVILIIFCLLLLVPLWLMISNSFSDIYGIMKKPPAVFPAEPTLMNYRNLLEGLPVWRWIINTLIITSVIVFISVGITAMAGYIFSIYRFRGQRLMFWMFMTAIMIPRQNLLIPLYIICRKLKLFPWAAVILPILFFPVGVFLFRNYCNTIPRSILDAARIDGAGEFKIFWSVIMPLCKPIIGVLCIFRSLLALGDYIWQYLLLQEDQSRTLLVGLIGAVWRQGRHAGLQINPIGLQLTAGTLLFIPMLIVFLTFQKHFISGLVAGGVK